MATYSVNADKERGKRLEKFLDETMPGVSWRARSHALDTPDSTVIGWRNGREISCDGLKKLLGVGCDVVWLLTGEAESGEVTSGNKTPPPAKASGEQEKRDRAIKATFRLAAVLVALGQHLVDGKSLDDFSMPSGLQDILQSLKMRLQEKEELDKARNHRGA